jgi:ADP-ribose pyrophosphatase YjhB (NUDIX family)
MARPTEHEVLAAVLRIRCESVQVLAWQRARPPDSGRWALPGGLLGDDEDVERSVRRQLAEKVDLREVTHVEQLAVFSRPDRVPGVRRIATAFLGLVPSDADPAVPPDTVWHPLAVLPAPVLEHAAFDHAAIVAAARDRLRAKLSYMSATNLQRVLTRRHVLEPTGAVAPPGPVGGRPAALFRFTDRTLRVTDAFAVLRPPGEATRVAVP